MKSRLSATAKIVQNPHFESAIVKIQDKEITPLCKAEKSSAYCLLSKWSVASLQADEEVTKMSFADKALKKRKLSSSGSKYVDTRFILPSTNIVERMSSKAGYVLNKRRKALTPQNLEM